jgi:hypothetical protein
MLLLAGYSGEGLPIVADFVVDYALLTQIENSLNRLTGEFEGIGSVPTATNWGDGGIAGAMGSFASNWQVHREKMIGSMEAMSANTQQCITQTSRYDDKMRQNLTPR